ncbi:MAG: ROK family protein [Proteobacteria bacterium]|nr:ROK family protein [Pseudomonadota bacterium]
MTTGTSATGAVDIGGTKIAVGAIDASGRVLGRADTPTSAGDGFDAAMTRIEEMLRQVSASAGIRLGGIGIGCTGPVDPLSGTIGEVEFLPGWNGANPVAKLADRFGVDVAMENDADAAALGELQWGAGRGRRHLICVTIGTGIGGGIVLNGALYRGVGGAHPEIGHHVIDDSGPQCYCGARGCWEVLASGPAIAAHARAALPADDPQRMTLTAAELCARARRGDALAQAEVARAGRYLGIGIANLISLYTPDAIVLSGSVMESADLFMPAIRAIVRSHCTQVPANRVTIDVAALGGEAPLIGAAAVWRHRYPGEMRPC